MKNSSAVAILAMMLGTTIGFAQQDKVIVPFRSSGYAYQFVKSSDTRTKTFMDPTKSDAQIGGWASTNAGGGWGTLNKPGTDPCPVNIADNVKILWPSGRDALLRKWFGASELAGATNVRITVAIDNAVIVYWNGQPVFLNGQPAGQFTHDVCAAETSPGSKTPAGDVTFTIPDTYLTLPAGVTKHLLAVRGVTLSEKSFIDVKVVVDMGYTLTTITSGPGTVEVSPKKDFYLPTDLITLKAAVTQQGYFFGRGSSPSTLQTGWAGIPFAAGADRFANPVTFSINQNTTVTAYFSPFPSPQEFPVSSTGDLVGGVAGEGTLREALEKAEKYPGPDRIVFPSTLGSTTIKLDAPLSASDLLIINQTGGLVAIEPKDPSTFGTGDALELPGVFVKWGYASGGISITGLKIQKFPGPGICINSDGNTVQGCVITLNGGDGICIEDGSSNMIGGVAPSQGNQIYDNDGRGISIREATPGDDIAPPSGNSLLGNSIYGNGALGIDFADREGFFGVTMNRYLNTAPYSTSGLSWDDFINNAQHYPELESADPLTGIVKCRFFAPAGKTFRVEVFRDWTPGPGGERQVLLGSTGNAAAFIPEGGSGYGVYTFELQSSQTINLGDVISATATDENGNTSEFSPTLYAGVKTRIFGPVQQPASSSNRWVANTTFRGLPIHWADGSAQFSIEEGFTSDPDFPAPSDGTIPVNIALGAWNYPGSPLAVSLAATPGPSEGWGGIPDGVNNIVWTKNFTSKTGPGLENALAVTRVRYNSFTGEIFDADVLINGGLVNSTKGYVFDAVMAHEFGHGAGGLGDIYDRNDQPYNLFMGSNPAGGQVTMYGIVKEEDTYQTTIHQDDKEGLNFIFGNVLPSYVDLALVLDASDQFSSAAGDDAFAPSINAAMEIVDKLRVGDGVAVVRFPGADQSSTSTVPVQFVRIGSANPQAQKDAIKLAIAGILPAVGDDRRPIGDALKAAALALPTLDPGRRGAILFSAGNETETPSALDPTVLQALGGTRPVNVFTMGFVQSPEGANTGSKLADATGGLFYETDVTTISPSANHAWDVLIGNQLVLDKQSFSTGDDNAISWQGSGGWKAISWQGAKNLAISWQGTTNKALAWEGSVDEGSTGLYPAISWQGGGTRTGKVSAEQATTATQPKFHLALITPDFTGNFYDPNYWANIDYEPEGTISPGHLPEGVEYVLGPAHAFYRINAQYKGKRDGTWILVPIGANGEDAPPPPEPVAVNGRFGTLTDVVMDVQFDRSNYLPGEPVTITVSLFEGGLVQASHTVGAGPIVGAAGGIKAAVTPPGGDPLTPIIVSFTEVGNGVYTATFTGTQIKGTYEFVVTAEGTAPVSRDTYFRKFDQSIYVAPPYASASLFAQRNVTMSDGSRVITGDILVNQQASGQALSLVVGLGASTPGGYDVKAHKIQILAGATVASSIYTGPAPQNAGAITGTVNTGVSFPLFSDANGGFPPFKNAEGDFTPNRSVGTGLTLDLGLEASSVTSYGDVSLEPHSTIRLAPGVYNFKSLRIKSGASLYFTGPTELRIRYGIHSDNGSYLGTEPGLSVPPSEIVIYVQGTNAQSDGSYSVDISPKSRVLASLFAPNGTIYLNQETQASGAFYAKDIFLGSLTTVRLSSGFGVLAKSGATGQEASRVDPADVPATYELSQNYPNPFNPTTRIKYGLPQAGAVRLTIYNMLGQEVARPVDEVQTEGYHVVEWNGRNHFGQTVGSGMYVFQLRAGEYVETRKMMLLK